jgi:hypothetical protein
MGKVRCVIYFFGDIHGDFKWWEKVRNKCDQSILLGDVGIGFPSRYRSRKIGPSHDRKSIMVPVKGCPITNCESFDLNHKFIYGNHDNPGLCIKHPNCLGHYGYLEESGIFFISGGYSIDVMQRTAYIDWWPDEQLDAFQLTAMTKLFIEKKPRIVVSHECPDVAIYALFGWSPKTVDSRQKHALNECWEFHKPEHWIFGHFHDTKSKVLEGTKFRCVGINQRIELPDVHW